MIKYWIVTAAMVMASGSGAFAADKTWIGKISDSKCGAKHAMGEHGKKMTDRECTEICVKGGAKYVFSSKGKVYQIANQDNADLAAHAGHTVRLTGSMNGDAITVSKMAMPKGSKH